MVASSQITPGMVLSIGDNLFRVESTVKVTVTKGAPFIKMKLKNLKTNSKVEKNFKPSQAVKEVSYVEKELEFLYMEGKDYMFLDVEELQQILVPSDVVGGRMNFLKEGVQLTARVYGDAILALELPQFLELMVVKTEGEDSGKVPVSNATKTAILETGAKVEVPPFIETGDIIKVDTSSAEYIQRV